MEKQQNRRIITLSVYLIGLALLLGIHKLVGTQISIENFLIGTAILGGGALLITRILTQIYRLLDYEFQDNLPVVINMITVVVILASNSFFIAWQTEIAFELLPFWKQFLLHFLGLVFAWFGYLLLTTYYSGNYFKIVGVLLTLVGYLFFAIFPKLTNSIATLIF